MAHREDDGEQEGRDGEPERGAAGGAERLQRPQRGRRRRRSSRAGGHDDAFCTRRAFPAGAGRVARALRGCAPWPARRPPLVASPRPTRARAAGPALAAVAALAAGPAAAAQARTSVVAFTPFAADGALRAGLRDVPAAASAACATGSFLLPGTGVLRCAVGVDVHDPCWLDVASSTLTAPVVACLSAPWRRDVLRLRVAPRDLHGEGGARPGSPPWALTLSSGLRCLAVQGASPRAHGRRLRYRCPGPRFLFGAPDTRRATWRIHLARSAGGAHQRRVAIRRAWVGGPAGTPAG